MIDGKKIYSAHTCDCDRAGKSKAQRIKHNLQGPVTAVMFRDGGVLKYGMSFCDPQDNFDKSYGFKQALERANTGFGEIKYTEPKVKDGKPVISEDQKIRAIMENLLVDAFFRRNRYQSKVPKKAIVEKV